MLLAGCSAEEAQPAVSTSVAVSAATTPTTTSSPVPDARLAEPTAASAPATVEVSIRAAAGGAEEVLSVSFDQETAAELDPFGEYASCSGLRASVGTYAVTVSASGAAVRAVSVLSSDRATTPGVHDAEVRVELPAGPALMAIGTITLDPGLRSGTFLAFDPGGNEIAGAFSCTGGVEAAPEPLRVGIDDGVLEAIEVVALLRRGAAERVVSLAIESETADTATMRCPGAIGASGDEVVLVDGDLRLGGITRFELSGGPSPTLQLRVGSASYDFVDVDATVEPPGASGVFTASTADGVTIDGAFRCS